MQKGANYRKVAQTTGFHDMHGATFKGISSLIDLNWV